MFQSPLTSYLLPFTWTETPVSYTLSHPKYLFGKATFTQTAHYCPPPPEEEEDEDEEGEEEGESGEPTHGDDGGGHETGGGEGGSGDGDGDHEPKDPSGDDRRWWDELPDDDMPGDEPTAPDDDPDEPSPGYEPDEEDPDEDDEDEARASCQMLRDVLKLRDPIEYSEPIRLVVPDEHRNCCPCPDHASNWVAVVYQSRRLVVVESESEVPFSRSGESLSVKVAGVEPSCKVGDAEIAFGVNGEVVKQGKYTVLGVWIESGYVPNVGTVDLRALNAFSPNFGLPVPVGTNDASMTGICLSTRVRLPSGNVHVGLEDVTGDFTVRYYDRTDQEWRVLVDSSSPSRDVAFSHWRRMVNGSADAYDEDATVYVTSTNAGSATLVYRYWNVLGGRVRFEISGAGNLVQYGGYPLPYEVDIGPGETVMFTNVYRAVAASGSENDIVARATFEDAADDFYDMSIARATAVKVSTRMVQKVSSIAQRYLQVFSINVSGSVKIEKFGFWVERPVCGPITHSTNVIGL